MSMEDANISQISPFLQSILMNFIRIARNFLDILKTLGADIYELLTKFDGVRVGMYGPI